MPTYYTRVVFAGGSSAQEFEQQAGWDPASPAVEYIRGSDYGGGFGGVLYTVRGGVPSFNAYNSRGDVVSKTDTSGSVTWQARPWPDHRVVERWNPLVDGARMITPYDRISLDRRCKSVPLHASETVILIASSKEACKSATQLGLTYSPVYFGEWTDAVITLFNHAPPDTSPKKQTPVSFPQKKLANPPRPVKKCGYAFTLSSKN